MEEMGLEYELEVMAFPPRFMQAGYTDINPIGTVPFFRDGDVEMTESAGISEYLVNRYGPTSLRVAPDESAYGEYLNWVHRSDATLTFPQTVALRYKLLEPEKSLQQAGDDYIAWFFSRLRSVERTMADREFLCADRFTTADICVGMALYLADEVLNLRAGFKPNTEAYYARLCERPAFIRTISV
jgi:glutathione S-transferase